jgi:hypothetical protein
MGCTQPPIIYVEGIIWQEEEELMHDVIIRVQEDIPEEGQVEPVLRV